MAREIKVYTFDELSEDAKKKVIEKYGADETEFLNSVDADDFYKTIKELCDMYDARTGRNYTDLSYDGESYYVDYLNEDSGESYETVREFVSDKTAFDLENDWDLTGTFADDGACKYIKDVLEGTQKPSTIEEFFKGLGDAVKADWESCEEGNSEFEVLSEQFSTKDDEYTEDGVRI